MNFKPKAKAHFSIESSPSPEGVRSAVDSFKLLGLLLRPASRRKLQLLLKFMKRVSGNDQLTLRRDTNNFVLVLDMFVRIIIRYVNLFGWDLQKLAEQLEGIPGVFAAQFIGNSSDFFQFFRNLS